MLDYARNLKLALGDQARRLGMKAGAGVVIAIGAGFLLAALWSWLATGLGWGPVWASLAVGGGFVVIGVAVMALASKPRHVAPTADDLKAEVEARLSLAADAAGDKLRQKAQELAGLAQNRAHSLSDDLAFRANKLADDAETRARSVIHDAAEAVGLDRTRRAQVHTALSEARKTNAGTLAPVMGAFAVGLVLASRMSRRRNDAADDDLFYDDY
ncbi:phage holin family protein [Paracoccus jiaweipingae]|uniref:phage holin family protein n=1 Tax=unclassified Paracoccus (in: a-proteobacteria) TaxID=2688777 RepID=UPI0037A5B9F1